MTKRIDYEKLIGGFSVPSKMPGYAWSITAHRCITGSKLAKVPGSVCSQCYALKGRYAFPNVQKALERRELLWHNTPPGKWTDNFVKALEYRYRNAAPADMYFRWFDSGDLRSVGMLQQIIAIAENYGNMHFWLPTREVAILQNWRKANPQAIIPANLVIRLSSPMVDDAPAKWWPTTSTVVKDPTNATCPAPQQSNKCGSCRACWSFTVGNVAYAAH
jgi:hypothetical protein